MLLRIALLLAITFPVLGCGGTTDPPAPAPGGDAHDHGIHGGGHEGEGESGHGHGAHGPHGGHILETSNSHFHAEWSHTDNGVITVHILDESGTETHPIEAKTVEIETAIAGGSPKTYVLNATGDGEESATFQASDLSLMAAMKIAGQQGATATLKFHSHGEDVVANIVHDDHAH